MLAAFSSAIAERFRTLSTILFSTSSIFYLLINYRHSTDGSPDTFIHLCKRFGCLLYFFVLFPHDFFNFIHCMYHILRILQQFADALIDLFR